MGQDGRVERDPFAEALPDVDGTHGRRGRIHEP
jgi:hypothetical protein